MSQALFDLYDAIKAQEANFPLPEPEVTITLGTLSLISVRKRLPLANKYYEEINFLYAIPTYRGPGYSIPYDPEIPDGPHIAYWPIPGFGGVLDIANIHNLNIEILITDWNGIGLAGNLQITLGSQTKTVAYGQPSVMFLNVANVDAVFSIIINNQFGANPVKALLPLKINWSMLGAGAITLPAIPVALVYAPVVDPQKKNSASTSSTITAGNTTTISFTTSSSTSRPVPSSFQNVMDMQKDLSTVGGALSQIPNPYTMAIGAGLSLIASGLGSSTAIETDMTSVNHQSSLTVISSSTETITANSSDGGPEVGDIIEYLYNVKVIWYSKNGKMTLGILGYEGSIQTTMGSLSKCLLKLENQPNGTKDTSLHLDIAAIQALQKLDPFTAGNQVSSLQPPRFTDISHGIKGIAGGGLSESYTYTVSAATSQTSTTTITTVENDSPGFLSFLDIGVTEEETLQTQISQTNILQTLSTQSVTQSFSLYGVAGTPYNSWIYYDNVFGVFAFRDMGV